MKLAMLTALVLNGFLFLILSVLPSYIFYIDGQQSLIAMFIGIVIATKTGFFWKNVFFWFLAFGGANAALLLFGAFLAQFGFYDISRFFMFSENGAISSFLVGAFGAYMSIQLIRTDKAQCRVSNVLLISAIWGIGTFFVFNAGFFWDFTIMLRNLLPEVMFNEAHRYSTEIRILFSACSLCFGIISMYVLKKNIHLVDDKVHSQDMENSLVVEPENKKEASANNPQPNNAIESDSKESEGNTRHEETLDKWRK